MDPSQFLAALWGENPPGMVNVFTLPERKSSWYSELTSVNRDMQQHLHKEVYTGVALARNLGGRFNTQRRVKEVDAAAIRACGPTSTFSTKFTRRRKTFRRRPRRPRRSWLSSPTSPR